MFNFLKKKNKQTTINISISNENELNSKESEDIEIKIKENHEKNQQSEKIKSKYQDILKQYIYITDELWNNNTYHLVNSQKNIFNKYADRYIELCNMYLQILPEYLNYEQEISKVHNWDFNGKYCPQDIVNMIILLDKQEKYNEIINVCNYLLKLGITEDKTKKGIKGRIEKAVNKFNEKYNTNYLYKDNIIIDIETGEVME